MRERRIQLHCSFLLLAGTLLRVVHRETEAQWQQAAWFFRSNSGTGPASCMKATRGSFSSTMHPSFLSKYDFLGGTAFFSSSPSKTPNSFLPASLARLGSCRTPHGQGAEGTGSMAPSHNRGPMLSLTQG